MIESTGSVPLRIFLSYRRSDTRWVAVALFDRLADQFGRDNIFKDVDSIAFGEDFVETISTAVGSSDVLLALIGNQWLTASDQKGRRRLDDPGDFVRLEIEAALARGVRVIPILVDGAQMPAEDQLPDRLAPLVRRQALELSPDRFGSDFQRLLPVLNRAIAAAQQQRRRQAEEAAARRQQIEQLQRQLRGRVSAQDWDAALAISGELAQLDPTAADPDGLASTAREQITRRQQAEETRRYQQTEETRRYQQAEETQQARERDAAQHRQRLEEQQPIRRISNRSIAWIWAVAAVATTLVTVIGLASLH
jgi:TIR domain